MSCKVLVRGENLVTFKDGRTIRRSFWLVKKSEVELLTVGSHREERDKARREDRVDSGTCSEGDGRENGGERDGGTRY